MLQTKRLYVEGALRKLCSEVCSFWEKKKKIYKWSRCFHKVSANEADVSTNEIDVSVNEAEVATNEADEEVESSLLNEPVEDVIASEDSNANENVKPDATSENICNICAKSFARADTLKRHENNVHASKSTETASPYRRPVTRRTATVLKVPSPQQKSHVQSNCIFDELKKLFSFLSILVLLL